MPLTLPPAQKALPAPVIRSTPTSGFSPQLLIIVRSAGVSVSDMAFFTSGRLSVMIATRSRITHRSSSVPVSILVSVAADAGASLMKSPPASILLCRVGKGARAPCPPILASSEQVGTLRFAHPTPLRAPRNDGLKLLHPRPQFELPGPG